ncbi:MAG: DUF4336 domain-containing protein [Gammaproteobacteria bacterium]|nr:DUF4336 domain-containing protein [Gammaproteobacteria bacterium]
MDQIIEYVPGQIWILEYPVRFTGMDLYGRTSIIRLGSGELMVHDPCVVTENLKSQIVELGVIRYIIVPGTYHHLYVADFQAVYPDGETFLCPGLETKRPDLKFDWMLGNKADSRWAGELEQVLIQGTRHITEVAFFHKPSDTLILVDLLENIGDDYKHQAGLLLRFYWKVIFRMWNNPKAAPEYQLGWGNKEIVKAGLEQILSWDAKRVILSHGENIEGDVNQVLRKAWKSVLNS